MDLGVVAEVEDLEAVVVLAHTDQQLQEQVVEVVEDMVEMEGQVELMVAVEVAGMEVMVEKMEAVEEDTDLVQMEEVTVEVVADIFQEAVIIMAVEVDMVQEEMVVNQVDMEQVEELELMAAEVFVFFNIICKI